MSRIIYCAVVMLIGLNSSAFAGVEKVKVDVIVNDESGVPVEGAIVEYRFANLNSHGGKMVQRKSNGYGETSLRIRTPYPISINVKKQGFYESNFEVDHVEINTDKRIKKKEIYSDQTVEVVLKKILEPIPMYAVYKLIIHVPVFDRNVGFDLIERDWVEPYGKGRSVDLYFNMSGYWNDYEDRDSTLEISFPCVGDGIVHFEMDNHSRFQSVREAPLSGYRDILNLRNAYFSDVVGIEKDVVRIEEGRAKKSYVFRVRTEVDSEGKITNCLYGKFYNSFLFYGVSEEERYNTIVLHYYINPTPLDRNLEFDPERNLFKNLKYDQIPSSP